MRWFVADKDYINYLHAIDSRVERIEYGGKIKPYVGVVLEIGKYYYYVPVSSPKRKHQSMKNNLDFLKICDKSGDLIAVMNLNNMIPIPTGRLLGLDYAQIGRYRHFDSTEEKDRYIDLLRKELHIINSMSGRIQRNAASLHTHCASFPGDNLSRRCCDFSRLEKAADAYPS